MKTKLTWLSAPQWPKSSIDDIISNLPEEDEDDWMDFDDDDDDFFDEPKKKDLNPSRPKKSKDLTLSRFG